MIGIIAKGIDKGRRNDFDE
jgi:hypothetical protein